MELHSTAFHPIAAAAGQDVSHTCWYHFSVDDVFDSLIEITDRKIPLLEHPQFALLYEMHKKYGTYIGLNLFFQKKIDGKMRTLSEVRDLQQELHASGDWLKFGPHALEFETAPYDQEPEAQVEVFDRIYTEIDRFAGKESYAQWVRLHYYSESYELAEYFNLRGVQALFSTDRPAGSHRMPEEIKIELNTRGHATYKDMNFIRTQFRIEFFVDSHLDEKGVEELIKSSLDTYGYIILYTHEYEFSRPEICEMLKLVLSVLSKLEVKSLKKI